MVPGTGRRYKRKGHRVHVASVPGRPPAPQSRRLHDSIMYFSSFGDKSNIGSSARPSDELRRPKKAPNNHVVSIGSNVPYALALEKGVKRSFTGGRIASRAYLWPSLKRSREMIKEAFTRV